MRATVLEQQIMRAHDHTCLQAILLDMKGFNLYSWGRPGLAEHLCTCTQSPPEPDTATACRPLVIPHPMPTKWQSLQVLDAMVTQSAEHFGTCLACLAAAQ